MSHSDSVPSIRRNAAWNCAGSLGDALLAFVMMPLVVTTLGETSYGLWVLIGSMTGYFGLLDLGVRGALGRQLAFHLARRDVASVNATLSTALALLVAACAVALVGVAGLQAVFFWIFDVPAEQVATVRASLWLAGLNLALCFPLSAFDAALWAKQRFDRLNQIDMSVAVMKAAAIVLFLTSANGLLLLPLVTLSGFMLAGILKIAATRSLYEGLRVNLRLASRSCMRDIFSFGLWNFTTSAATQLATRIPPMLIGALLSPAAVTPYGIAARLLSFTHTLFASVTGIFTPRSAGYAALDDSERQVDLFLFGGRMCWAAAIFASLGMCFFGRPFIALWLGPGYEMAAWYLAILALGALVPLSQSLTGSVLLGVARHQFLAVLAIGQVVVGVALSLVAVQYYGGLGICAAMSAASLAAGLGVAWHGCRVLGVRLVAYARQAVVPAVAACVAPAVVAVAMVSADASLLPYAFATQMLLYSLLFAVFCYWTCLRPFAVFPGGLTQDSC